MKLSRKSEYACLALIHLTEKEGEGLVKIEDISTAKSIPKKYLEQILLILKGSGYVRSVRGADGGYKLAKPSSQISLAEILRLIDGPLAPVESVSQYFYEQTPIEQCPGLVDVFRDIRDYMADKLESTTFSHLI